jgi:hypothetical protein
MPANNRWDLIQLLKGYTGVLERGFESIRLGKGISRVGEQLPKEVRVTSVVPPNSVLCQLPFLLQVNDIWRNIDRSIRLFVDDSIRYGKHTNKSHMVKLQKDLNTLGNGQ